MGKAALRPGGSLILRDAMAKENAGHQTVARSEKWAVRLGQNRTRRGLHFEDEKTHLAWLRGAGFEKLKLEPKPAWVQTGYGLFQNFNGSHLC